MRIRTVLLPLALLIFCTIAFSAHAHSNYNSEMTKNPSPKLISKQKKIKGEYAEGEVEACQRHQQSMVADKTTHNSHASSHEDSKREKTHQKAMPSLQKNHSMPKSKMVHQDHNARHGGDFFMASNNKYHLEGVYSKECGFQLYLYNEFTEPIRVNRFQAFIRIIKEEGEGEIERFRFLSPTKGHRTLQSPVDLGLLPPFEIELYLKFPDIDVPDLFNFL